MANVCNDRKEIEANAQALVVIKLYCNISNFHSIYANLISWLLILSFAFGQSLRCSFPFSKRRHSHSHMPTHSQFAIFLWCTFYTLSMWLQTNYTVFTTQHVRHPVRLFSFVRVLFLVSEHTSINNTNTPNVSANSGRFTRSLSIWDTDNGNTHTCQTLQSQII